MGVIQVILSVKEYGPKSSSWVFHKDAELNYGYSFYLAWFVFSVNLLSGCGFILLSKKRKRDRAPNDEFAMADEPTIIGRWWATFLWFSFELYFLFLSAMISVNFRLMTFLCTNEVREMKLVCKTFSLSKFKFK